MAGPFSAMDVAATGASFSQFWIDALAHNIANVNTVRPEGEAPFEAVMVQAQARTDSELGSAGSGVQVSGTTTANGQHARAYDPNNPNADEEGYVTMPNVDLAAHMSDLIIAQRSFQASVKAIKSAEEMYRSSLQIGQR